VTGTKPALRHWGLEPWEGAGSRRKPEAGRPIHSLLAYLRIAGVREAFSFSPAHRAEHDGQIF